MNQINLMQRVDAGLAIAGPFVDLQAPTEDEVQRMRDGIKAVQRKIDKVNRSDDARALEAALDQMAAEE